MYKVFIVEDEIQLQEFLIKNLKKHYNIVGTAASGEKAISMVSEAEPDVVLMDINLEGKIDGIETAQRIQENHKVAILFLTSRKDDEALQKTRRIKPFGYIVKPVDLSHLKSNIEICIRMYKELAKSDQAPASPNKSLKDFDLEEVTDGLSENVGKVSMEWTDKSRLEISNDNDLRQYWIIDK